MALGPFLRRELLTSARRGAVFAERRAVVVLAALVVALCVAIWDGKGKDRASVAGASSFARVTFAWVVAAQAIFAIGLVPILVAPGIASERDRKSLDSLLTTRLSALGIVLGMMGAGLLRYLDSLAALAPVVVLMMFLGGVDPRLVLLALAGVGSTAIALAALSVAISAGARTALRAKSAAISWALAWMGLPGVLVFLVPRAWPAAAPWTAPIALPLLDSSLLGVGLSVAGLVARGPLSDALPRMIALQGAATVLLVSWAIVRLRPASRAVYDEESRRARLRLFRASWRPRPACGDDPVLWHELHPGLRGSPAALWADRLVHTLWIGLIAYGTSVFALPAFAELFRQGYGPGAPTLPEVNPVVRLLVGKLVPSYAGPGVGNARLEFNIVLRLLTGAFDALLVLMVAGAAAEGVGAERERDTWLGLIATPLTGREILRAKMLGAFWKSRLLASLMLALWAVGLLAGAVHPAGFLAAIVGMGASLWLMAAWGAFVSLRSRDRAQATGKTLGPLVLLLTLGTLPFLLPGKAGAPMAFGTMPCQAWASPLSHEDIHAGLHSRPIPALSAVGIEDARHVWALPVAWLASTAAQALGAFLLTRSALRDFDALIGRPTRARDASPPHSESVP